MPPQIIDPFQQVAMSSIAVRSFYRTAWRESIRCQDYSTKFFIRRKLRERCRKPTKEFIPSEAETHLEQIKRVVNVSNMYASERSVLEKM